MVRDTPDYAETELRIISHMITVLGILPWRPIYELTTITRQGDAAGFLIMAPELVDEDCNVHGIGMGYWDDLANDNTGGWLACKWDMQNDEWREVPCQPTHYLRLKGLSVPTKGEK